MVCMTVWDFVIGVLFGIVVSCKQVFRQYPLPLLTMSLGFFFVLQNSRRNSIRTVFTGENAISAVRRPNAQRAYIREASKQTMILRLQGIITKDNTPLMVLTLVNRFPFLWNDYHRRGSHPQTSRRSRLAPPSYQVPCSRSIVGGRR